MTFKKFESLFKQKYPSGEVCGHGKFAQTEKNKKVAVVFNEGGKVYEYYGAYEDILNRLGIKVISESRLYAMESVLEHYKEHNGKPLIFGGIADYDEKIAALEKEIEEIKRDYVIA